MKGRPVKLTPLTSGALVENGVVSVGFGDFAELPTRSFVLSRLLEPTAQDIALGEDALALADENGWTAYAPFTSVSLRFRTFDATLTPEAQSCLGLPAQVTTGFDSLGDSDRRAVVIALRDVIGELP